MATRDWAVITGVSSGIGAAFAELLASKGINLIMTSRDGTRLTSQATGLEKRHGIKTIIYAGDLSQSEAAEGLVRIALEAKVRIRYVINNAGFGNYGSFIKTNWEREYEMINLNVTALTYLSKAFGSYMAKRGEGHILNLASTAAFFSGPNMAAYYATKAYVLHLSEAIGEELRPSGVTVTALCPGPTATNFANAANANQTRLFGGKLPAAERVADYGYRAMLKGVPVAIYGRRNRAVIWLSRFVPRRILVRIIARNQG